MHFPNVSFWALKHLAHNGLTLLQNEPNDESEGEVDE